LIAEVLRLFLHPGEKFWILKDRFWLFSQGVPLLRFDWLAAGVH
jgi:hypothetical protein